MVKSRFFGESQVFIDITDNYRYLEERRQNPQFVIFSDEVNF